MARDRDHQLVAATTRREAAELRRRWNAYVEAGRHLDAIAPCALPWPSSLQDTEPVPCQLLQGHPPGAPDSEAPGGHRHRIRGTQVVVTW